MVGAGRENTYHRSLVFFYSWLFAMFVSTFLSRFRIEEKYLQEDYVPSLSETRRMAQQLATLKTEVHDGERLKADLLMVCFCCFCHCCRGRLLGWGGGGGRFEAVDLKLLSTSAYTVFAFVEGEIGEHRFRLRCCVYTNLCTISATKPPEG